MASDAHQSLHFGPLDTIGIVTVFIGFCGIAIYNAIELLIRVFIRFKRRTNLYFWSLVVASLGLLVYQVFIYILVLNKIDLYIVVTFILVSWVCMVTGQSMVLWSRLHLILLNPFKLKLLLFMIIGYAIIFHGFQIALTYVGAATGNLDAYRPFQIGEKVSVVAFSVQETIISCVYMIETLKMLRAGQMLRKRNAKSVMIRLLITNIFIVAMDVTLVFLEFFGLWGVWCSFKGVVYSVKLRIEFDILNQLQEITTGASSRTQTDGESAENELKSFRKSSRIIGDDHGDKKKSVGYSVFSVHSGGEQGILHEDKNSILATTEVVVKGTDKMRNRDGEVQHEERVHSTDKHDFAYSNSPTSSKLGFAVEGA